MSRAFPKLCSPRVAGPGLGVQPGSLQPLATGSPTYARDFVGRRVGSFPVCTGGSTEGTKKGVLLCDCGSFLLHKPCLKERKKRKLDKGRRGGRGSNMLLSNQQSVLKGSKCKRERKKLPTYWKKYQK